MHCASDARGGRAHVLMVTPEGHAHLLRVMLEGRAHLLRVTPIYPGSRPCTEGHLCSVWMTPCIEGHAHVLIVKPVLSA